MHVCNCVLCQNIYHLWRLYSCLDCSIGSLSFPDNDSPISGAQGSVVILPEEVTCNGILTSWETCAFFNSSQTTTPDTLFLLRAGVYRPNENAYVQIHVTNLVPIPPIVDDYVCFNRIDSVGVEVQVRDRLFAVVSNSNCFRGPNNLLCPLNPVQC